jgi:hypothetical protein
MWAVGHHLYLLDIKAELAEAVAGACKLGRYTPSTPSIQNVYDPVCQSPLNGWRATAHLKSRATRASKMDVEVDDLERVAILPTECGPQVTFRLVDASTRQPEYPAS